METFFDLGDHVEIISDGIKGCVVEVLRDIPKDEKELRKLLAQHPKERKSGRIHEFTIIGRNAWNEVFLFSMLEEGVDGNISLKVVYGKETYSIDIVDQEEFIQKLRVLNSINGKSYEFFTEDGFNWCLRTAYDNKVIVSCGINAAPSKLYKFFKSLGIEIDIFDVNIGHPKIENIEEDDDIFIIGNIKILNRYSQERDSCDEEKKKYEYLVYESDEYGRYKLGIKGSL